MSLPGLVIRPMALGDIDTVSRIDQSSFSLPWPKSTFRYELEQNEVSRCWVVELQEPGNLGQVVAMAVVWMVVDEAHIATIAVLPAYRRIGIGRMLIKHILYSAIQENMATVTLEVRPSNLAAQALYQGFGFEAVGRRLRYYHDTNEDAIIMTKKL